MKSKTLTTLPVCLMIATSLLAFQTLRAQAPTPTLTKITTAPFTVDVGNAHGCVWVDYDSDGFIDLFDSNYNIFQSLPSYLYRNNGNGSFTRQTNGSLVKLASESSPESLFAKLVRRIKAT